MFKELKESAQYIECTLSTERERSVLTEERLAVPLAQCMALQCLAPSREG